MVVPNHVQREGFPDNLPFRVISRTVGQGAYAFIRRACPHTQPTPVIAVKFINKHHALKIGKVKPKQIQAEVALHSHVGKHRNIIEFLGTGEDERWTWIAMELASGDLFDKIEADVGVGEDVAHFYFSQLVSAVGYMHSRNVAHRDIKPENILLSSDGDLKLADFGLAVLFGHNGQRKPCQTVCGSPPYMAPEVVPKDGFTGRKTEPYEGDVADIWSCGIVLFVLLVGNTPWDEPTKNIDEFNDYVGGKTIDPLWTKLPLQARSLLRGILRVDAKSRMNLEDVRRHPWFTRPNSHLTSDGRAANPIGLATQMLQSLHIDFNADPTTNTASSQRPSKLSIDPQNATDVDSDGKVARLAFTQPETPIIETQFDWEPPARVAANNMISASQPTAGTISTNASLGTQFTFSGILSQDPSLSQFSQVPTVPISVTQQARRFRDIVPEHSLARFFSFMDYPLLLPLLCEALGRLGIPTARPNVVEAGMGQRAVFIPVKTRDQRNCTLAGMIAVDAVEEEVLEVRFLKATGDPLEWRRLFKKIAILCKDAILKPDH